ncbi:tyrosine-type recombinase/integrase [Kribbella sp. NPDC050281]|uniref:tyrosine-type recombinase/integrase n=1 Tax=Kribbella sp. NPDC050281 TaxID=3155515 RepID=UPI0033C6751B
MDELREELLHGRIDVPRVGEALAVQGRFPPFVVVDATGAEVAAAVRYLRDLALGDVSPLTCRSYAFALLRWFRLLWVLGVDWDRATSSEVAVLVGWMKSARNPQRTRRSGPAGAGAVNPRTGKRALPAGYAPRTINHALTVVYRFYDFHAHHGDGPVLNPVPVSRKQRATLSHRSPLEPLPTMRRSRLRQRVPKQLPRAMADRLWDELFAVMGCDRDRALLSMYVSSGARASELLGIGLTDVDWGRQLIHVVSKGTRLRQSVPVSPESLRNLTRYLAEAGLPGDGEPLWRTRRGGPRQLSYWAMRRVLQRANERLGTDWTLHDLRHTAATRLANDPGMTLTEVRAILRHADINTTGIYTAVRVEDLFDKLQEHYARPRPTRQLAPGYDPDDVKIVFGG